MNIEDENLYGKGITDSEFKDRIIKVLLGTGYYVADPISNNQVNEIVLEEIIQQYGDNNWKYRYINYTKLIDEEEKLKNLIKIKNREIDELSKKLDGTKFNRKYSKLCKQKIDLELKQDVVRKKMKKIKMNYDIDYDEFIIGRKF